MKAMYIFTYFSFIWLACTAPVLWAVWTGGRLFNGWVLRVMVGLMFSAFILAGVIIAGFIYSLPPALVAILLTVLTLVDLIMMVAVSVWWQGFVLMVLKLFFNVTDRE